MAAAAKACSIEQVVQQEASEGASSHFPLQRFCSGEQAVGARHKEVSGLQCLWAEDCQGQRAPARPAHQPKVTIPEEEEPRGVDQRKSGDGERMKD